MTSNLQRYGPSVNPTVDNRCIPVAHAGGALHARRGRACPGVNRIVDPARVTPACNYSNGPLGLSRTPPPPSNRTFDLFLEHSAHSVFDCNRPFGAREAQQVARHALDHFRDADGRHRFVDRQRRAAAHDGNPRRHRAGDHVDLHRLHHCERGRHAADRVSRPALRSKTRVHVLLRALLLGSVLCGTARTLPALIFFRAFRGSAQGHCSRPNRPFCARPFRPRSRGWRWHSSPWRSCSALPSARPSAGGSSTTIHGHGSFISTFRSGYWGFHGATFVHEDEDIVANNLELAEKQRKTSTGGHRPSDRRALLLQYLLEEGDRNDWFQSTSIAIAFGAAIVVIALFVVRDSLRGPGGQHPALQRSRVSLGNLIGALMFALLMATMFLLPLFMQTLLGFTATDAGFALMPRVLVMMIAVPIVGRIYNSVSPRIVIAARRPLHCMGSVRHEPLHAANWSRRHHPCADDARHRLLLPLRASFDRSARGDSAASDGRRDRPQLAIPANRRDPSVGRRCHDADSLRGPGAVIAARRTSPPPTLRPWTGCGRARKPSWLGDTTRSFRARWPCRHSKALSTYSPRCSGSSDSFLMAGLCFMLVLPLLLFLKTPKVLEERGREKVDVHVEI